MKICWNNLEKIDKITRNGNFKIKSATYIYMNSCEICNNPYLTRSSQKSKFCSISCVQKNKNNNNWKHGHIKNTKKSSTYISWLNMKMRCLNTKADGYHNYGGRGIKVCKRWMVFKNFLEDMGERPEGKTIDRINVNGNYELNNCKWSTSKEQHKNKRFI